MNQESVVIASFSRTPIANFLGSYKAISATELGSLVIKSALERANLLPKMVDEVLLGCVLTAGLGQAPARQASLRAGIPNECPCTTISKVCGSGMRAIMFASDFLRLGSARILIAGGMENMTRAPYLLNDARSGLRLGHKQMADHMMLDGLEDAYEKTKPMGYFAEQTATKYNFTRIMQDEYALESFRLAREASNNGGFQTELISVNIPPATILQDEHPFSVNPEKIPQLKPVFVKDGTVTAGNASSLADGAAALVLMSEGESKLRNVQPLAKVLGYCSVAKSPAEFCTAPVFAIQKLLAQLNWHINDVDLFEINEAFAVVPLAAMQELKIPREKLNVHGGAIALGHPIGASGARIVVSLISALRQRNLTRGVASLCIGGGEATALALEICEGVHG